MQIAEAKRDELNFVGVEIRKPVLELAQHEAQHRALRNLCFLHGNMNIQQRQLITSFVSNVKSVSIFHPDPWIKKRHYKRRLVTQSFVSELAQLIPEETPVFIQTDVKELFQDICSAFNQSQCFEFKTLAQNPFEIPTDREQYVVERGGAIFRAAFVNKPRVP